MCNNFIVPTNISSTIISLNYYVNNFILFFKIKQHFVMCVILITFSSIISVV